MDIQVEPINFNASQDLITHIEELFSPLTKYNDQITSMDIYMESANGDQNDKMIKVKVLIPGHELFVQEQKSDFVSAAQTAYDKLKHLLAERKERDKSNFKQRPDKVY